MPDADADVLDRLLDHLRASTVAQVVSAERLQALTSVVEKVHDDLTQRNTLEKARQKQAESLWAKAGSKPALMLYAAVVYVVLAAAGVDPGPLIRALVGTDHHAHVPEIPVVEEGE